MASFSEKLSRFFSNWNAAADDDFDDDRNRYDDADMFEEEYYPNEEFGPASLNEQFARDRRDARNSDRRPRNGRQPGFRQGDAAAQQSAQQAGKQRDGQYEAQYARQDEEYGQGDYAQGGYSRGEYQDAGYRGHEGGDRAGYERQGAYGAGDYGQQQYGSYGRDGVGYGGASEAGGGGGSGIGAGAGSGAGAGAGVGAAARAGAGSGAGAGSRAGSGAGSSHAAGSAHGAGGGGGGRGTPNNVLPFPQRGMGSVIINAKPERYVDAQMICQHLRERHIVIFSLEDMEHEQARRVFDFVSGGVSVLDASIEKHSRMIFSVAPNNVSRMPFKDETHDFGFESFGGGMGPSRTRSAGNSRSE